MVGSIPRDKSHDRGQTAVMRQVTGWGAAGELNEVIRLVTLGSFQGADKGQHCHTLDLFQLSSLFALIP